MKAELYEDAYRHHRQRPPEELREELTRGAKRATLWVRESKDRFLTAIAWERLRILECGGGMGGLALELARMGARTTMVDFAPGAVAIARDLGVDAHVLDVTMPDARVAGPFDLIVDSHLLHCLPTIPARASYFQFLRDHLAPGGIVVGETMVHRKKMYVPLGWRLDDEGVLWQKFADWVPVRRIADSLVLEEEFRAAGFRISYFYYYANYGIAPSAEFWDIPAEVLPASVRYVLSRAD